jgi:hypothetical protein
LVAASMNTGDRRRGARVAPRQHSNLRLSRRSWTSSFCSALVWPSTTPSSTSVWRTKRRTDSTETSKSAATSAWLRSPRRATRTNATPAGGLALDQLARRTSTTSLSLHLGLLLLLSPLSLTPLLLLWSLFFLLRTSSVERRRPLMNQRGPMVDLNTRQRTTSPPLVQSSTCRYVHRPGCRQPSPGPRLPSRSGLASTAGPCGRRPHIANPSRCPFSAAPNPPVTVSLRF